MQSLYVWLKIWFIFYMKKYYFDAHFETAKWTTLYNFLIQNKNIPWFMFLYGFSANRASNESVATPEPMHPILNYMRKRIPTRWIIPGSGYHISCLNSEHSTYSLRIRPSDRKANTNHYKLEGILGVIVRPSTQWYMRAHLTESPPDSNVNIIAFFIFWRSSGRIFQLTSSSAFTFRLLRHSRMQME